MAKITLKGNPCNTNGELPAIGTIAPDFALTAGDLQDVSLATYAGKKKLLNIVPSLDTEVCATSTRKFNETFAGREDAIALVISADLPFASGRFCSIEGIKNVIPLSMMRNKTFAESYGLLIKDGPLAGLCARSIIILDADNKVTYTELVPEIVQEPDYAAAKSALG